MTSQYTPKLAASHVDTGTAIPLEERGTVGGDRPHLRLPKLHLEFDARLRATCYGGTTLLLALWRRFKVSDTIADGVRVLQRQKPYQESDHVLTQVLNLFTGGTCIEDQATLQQDQAVLRLLGSDRFPDPTTSGDFLRRFDERCKPGALDGLRSAVDQVRLQVWAELQKRRKRPRAKLGRMGKRLGLLALPLETPRWEWKRFRCSFVYVAAEVVLRSRQTWVRFNPPHRYIPIIMRAHLSLGP